MNEVWVLKYDCGHEPQIFADRKTPYEYIKKYLTETINYFPEEFKSDSDYFKELCNDLTKLEESYSEGGDFGIDGLWYCNCYKVYQEGEMPN